MGEWILGLEEMELKKNGDWLFRYWLFDIG
jgi:hypothetical protein